LLLLLLPLLAKLRHPVELLCLALLALFASLLAAAALMAAAVACSPLPFLVGLPSPAIPELRLTTAMG
jgi:hypothetical protein